MRVKQKVWLGALILAALIFLAFIRLHNLDFPVLQPQGVVGHKEKNLILVALGLCAIVVIPVYIMLFSFAWKYRASNKQARYEPNYDHSRWLEGLWWGIPFTIIAILAVITWNSSHDLDPFKSLTGSTPPVTVQAVALQWKWLFIYPQQGIASVNYLMLPVNTPIDFQITADAPMNSLWIPQLGGQVYAMSGMSTELHLEASQTGRFYGSSANISGDGFAGMHFTAESARQSDFLSWVNQAKLYSGDLNVTSYSNLAKPSQNNPAIFYGNVSRGLYSYIVNKFVTPPNFTPKEAV